ncbi:DMT family transporter [Streptomyces sp. NPDC086835]|jgi:drug/metabolite transporter (DMT)-like permease|uniref:DMT family transporter n=1 Tax=Streptomyces sp. NPDC086835 TaxID=3365761 RepID=UPI003804E07F
MTALSVCLALLAALANAAASVLQRRALADLAGATAMALLRRPGWVWGAAMLVLSGALQALALATGPLAVVQPVMSTELLFTLVVGGIAFRRRPDPRTRVAFVAMAVGLGGFLALAAPSGGRDTVPTAHWAWAGLSLAAAVAVLVAVSLRLPSAPRAAVLGTATAIGFSCTAVLMKDALGRLPEGVGAVFATWQLYAAMAVGLGSFLLLQVTLRAGSLAASQPALTLGDALLSVVLGVVLFQESVHLGWRTPLEVVALGLLIGGCVELARSPLLAEDPESAEGTGKW